MRVKIDEPHLQDANCLIVTLDCNTIIVAIYRPPGYKNIDPFIQSLNTLLLQLKYANVILIGDINIDIRANNIDNRSPVYLNLLASHGILPAHYLPTHGATCLDHVMVKTKLPAACYVAESSVTDHDSLVFVLNYQQLPQPSNLSQFKKIDYNSLDNDMKTLNFNDLYSEKDANVATSKFISQLNTKISCNTFIFNVPNRKRINKPWITTGLLRCMKNRDKLHQKCKKFPNNEIITTTYKRYRNFCNGLLKKLKREYEHCQIQNALKTNNKMLWDTIKKVTHTNKEHNPASNLICPFNPADSVNNINYFFANIGSKLTDTTHNISHLSPPLIPSQPFSFFLNPIEEEEVKNVILSIKKPNSVGRDNISGAFLKRYYQILVPPLTHIYNLMFSTGIFPDEFKLAEVIPVHKSGNRDCVNNYRPISILSTISKIAEKLLNKRLIDYLETKNILSSSQFGFRTLKSTNDAVHEVIDHVVDKLDKKKKVLAIFLDLAKAFDTVSIPLLLNKLEKIGIRNMQLKLLTNYLKNRQQRVRIGDIISADLPITCGVPQGSVLGPTLFLIFINDLCNLTIPNGKIVMFADDTVLIFHGETWEQTYSFAQTGFDMVNYWLMKNSLTLNVDKTKIMPFTIKNTQLSAHNQFSIIAHVCSSGLACSCSKLTITYSMKYLGVLIDNTLSFAQHIDLLSSRTRKMIFIFKNLRHIADYKIIKMVYIAFCQSILSYCITVWGGMPKTKILKLERAQRAVLKVSLFLPFRFPTNELYSIADVLTIRKLFILNIILKQHSLLHYDPDKNATKRLKHLVCPTLNYRFSAFSKKFFCFLGGYLYNKINKNTSIYPLTKSICKRVITLWLKSLNYDATENLLSVLS